ncbi:MAG: rod shape-determining protein MreC [Desulfomicrobium sp.]|nr:rod shape-determining protein MreC [Pseudomonadota bacterium]MBV1714035.1 rod shape-determining protein MreC [Desulfomicrobium sp.]MBU4571572.1 rod shape-determining protein MreC [Pseudomonadota bacterium]MBU4595720.1 rod shape-determining protein MreC [Pseudomonadota bacterium]MBV1721638.1 rod shape-determining protein MreC [Desulfomicrobium sp.]
MSPRFKRLVLFFFLPLFVYFSMYTWNWKTGHLDRLAALTGLELTGWVLAPGRWLQSNVDEFWSRYVYLVGVRQENEDLVLRVRELEQELGRVSEKAKSVDRLNALLRFSPEPPWEMRGGRVIGQKLGPNAILETLLIDVGSRHGVRVNDPVISPRGVVGRIAKPGIHFSSVVLLSDPSSRIPVITSEGRVPAIVQGQGPGAFLEVKFIPRNDPVSPGEILLSSGLGGVYPKGLPVARVVEVTPADVSLFQRVYAEPLLALRYYEELLVLNRTDGFDPGQQVMGPPATNASLPDGPGAASDSPAQPAEAAPAQEPAVSAPQAPEPATATRHPVRKKP